MSDLDAAVREIAAEMAVRSDRGEVANYISELARIDVGAFGIAAIDAEGQKCGGASFYAESSRIVRRNEAVAVRRIDWKP